MKASLIILTYNELYEGTIPCVESIYKYTNFDDFELIIVDNCSKDDTPKYLQELKEKYSNIKIQLNETNKGFAAGMNDGLKLAEGDFLVLLNNDILVNPNWLEKLINPLMQNPEIAMTGPISNGSGNEQCVNFDELDKNNYIDVTKNYIERQRNEIYFTNRLAFFCVAISRKVFEKIGFLDENFGLGWFEDDDYCLRARKAGYKIAIAEDCFIYHHGSLSFSKAPNEHAKKNELYFTQKHNCKWTRAAGAVAYFEKIKNDLNKYCLNSTEVDPNIERIITRIKCFESYLKYLESIESNFREEAKTPLWKRIISEISSPERKIRNYIKKNLASKNR